MRNVGLAIAITSLFVALSGCSGTPERAPEPQRQTVNTPAPAPGPKPVPVPAAAPAAPEALRVGAAVRHENLAVYPIYGGVRRGAFVPADTLTLDEAIAQKVATV